MAKFQFLPLVTDQDVFTARLGAGVGAANFLTDKEIGKFLKQTADSRYDLCSVGNPIEGVLVSVESATLDNFTIGTVQEDGRVLVTFDGAEAGGAGAMAVGDFVVCGTAVAKDTSLLGVAPKVRKATNQPGTAIVSVVGAADTAAAIKTQIDAVLVKVASAQANLAFGWRVVSLGTVGTGAVGTVGLIERIG